jgi:PBSX family phage terminase large subunit
MQVELLNHQWDFLHSGAKFCLLLGGIGSGKTYAGAQYVINKVAREPKAMGFIGANTYGQLTKSTLPALFTLLTEYSIPFSYNQHKGIVTIQNTKVIAATMDNYDVHRGIEIGWAWLDECRDMKQAAVDVVMGRLRDKKCKKHEIRFTSSPKSFNWMYDYFHSSKSDDFHLVSAKSRDNTYLPDGYLDTLYEQYDSKFAEQELEGRFVNISAGRVYYGFSREHNTTSVVRKKELMTYIGMDFNVNPMTAVVANVTDTGVFVFDEIYLPSSNTHEMARLIKERYGTHVNIVPDATGSALKTSAAGVSDHEILRRHGFKIMATINPFRMDRYNAVNNLLEKQKLFIDNKCVKLIRDLEQLSYKEGTNLPDTSDKTLSHISDALGYLVYKTHGIKPQYKARIRLS